MSIGIDFLGRKKEDKNPYRALRRMQTRPIVFLGLGGVGSSAVSKIKTLFERTFAEHMEEGQQSPIPPGIQFLCFDSAASERPPNLAAQSEWCQMVAQRIDSVLPDLRRQPFYASWLPDVTGHDYHTGAGGMRALGRLLFSRNIQKFHEKFSEKMNAACRYPRLDSTRPLVCVFSSLAGGTGSGSILDACFYIRRNFPGADVYGFLAVVGGLPNLDPVGRVHATVGAYAALREIDAFMDDHRLTGDYRAGKTFDYPAAQGIQGKYDRPFDQCFLAGMKNARGVVNLPDSGRLSSFLARCAFMLTAYSTESHKGVRSFEAEMCDRSAQLSGLVKEALARYCVPAVGQLHLPLVDTADYLCCALAAKFLTFLDGGDPYPDEQSSDLLDSLGLRAASLAERLARYENGTAIRSLEWSGDVDRDLQDKKFRYSKKGRTQVLGYGDGMVSHRADDYAAAMKAEVAAELQRAKEGIFDAVAAALKNPAHRCEGVVDLLADLARGLRAERLQAEGATPRKEEIEAGWSNLRPLIDDVCTNDSWLDFDRFKLKRARDFYVSFLNGSDAKVLERVKGQQSADFLRNVSAYVEELTARVDSLRQAARAAHVLVSRELEGLARKLHAEEQGAGASADDICSFSLLGSEWRKAYLSEEARFGNPAVLSALTAGDWGPARWLDLVRQERSAEHLAQDLCERIDRALVRGVRAMTIEDAFGSRTRDGGSGSDELLARTIFQYTSPQIAIQAMTEHLDRPPTTIDFIGGIDEDLFGRLRQHHLFEDIARAISWEEGKVSYLGVEYPVALAGCDPLLSEFQPSYAQWKQGLELNRDKAESERERRKFHCFGDSDRWQDPTYYRRAASEDLRVLSQAFGISVILDPARLGAAHAGYPALSHAVGEIGKVSKSPREKRLSLFRVGKSDIWLNPFFDPADPRNVARPMRLGTRLSKVRDTLVATDGAFDEAKRWVQWFDERWADYFTTDELRRAIDAAADEAKKLQSQQSSGSEDCELWAEVVRLLDDWGREKAGE